MLKQPKLDNDADAEATVSAKIGVSEEPPSGANEANESPYGSGENSIYAYSEKQVKLNPEIKNENL